MKNFAQKKYLFLVLGVSIPIVFGVAFFFGPSGQGQEEGVDDLVKVLAEPGDELVNDIEADEISNSSTTSQETVMISPQPGSSKEVSSDENEADDELARLEKFIEQTEGEWKEKVETLFVKNMGLSQNLFWEYESLRTRYQEDKISWLNHYQAKQQKQNVTGQELVDADAQRLAITEDYHKKLKDLIGAANYKKYDSLKSNFNRQLLKKQDPRIGVISIDF